MNAPPTNSSHGSAGSESVISAAWTTLAQLLRPQGRKGELLAELLTDFPERFTDHPRVFLAPAEFKGPQTAARTAEVTSFWLPSGKNQGRIVLAFAGIDSITQAESIAGLEVLIPTEERLPLEEGAEYIDDLIGCAIYDGLTQIGTLDSIEFSTGADGKKQLDVAPLLTVVTSMGDEILIPYVQQFLLSVDIPARRIQMSLPEGLVDLNLRKSQAEAAEPAE